MDVVIDDDDDDDVDDMCVCVCGGMGETKKGIFFSTMSDSECINYYYYTS